VHTVSPKVVGLNPIVADRRALISACLFGAGALDSGSVADAEASPGHTHKTEYGTAAAFIVSARLDAHTSPDNGRTKSGCADAVAANAGISGNLRPQSGKRGLFGQRPIKVARTEYPQAMLLNIDNFG
jgi:hypothetical protein